MHEAIGDGSPLSPQVCFETHIIAESQIDALLDERIRNTLCRCFPAARDTFSVSRAWHGSSPAWTVLTIAADDAIAGHVGIVDRTIQAADKHLRVGGIQNVCVTPEHRGQGLLDRILTRTLCHIFDEGMDAGLLFCTEALVKVYARYGWRLLEGASVCRITENGDGAPLPSGSVAMWAPVYLNVWPAGPIHLAGNDW